MRALILLVSLTMLVAASAPSAMTTTGPAVVRLISVNITVRTKDVPPKGVSKGDYYKETNRLLNAAPQFGKPKGAVVGSDRGTTRLVSKTAATADGTATLPGGTIVIRGLIRALSDRLVIPVVGGTGRFAGAHGTLTVMPGGSQGHAINVYRLSYPPTA